jgi:GxxExxY protein
MATELLYKELSESIIGAAMTVLNTLKPGLDEKLYERALVIELRKRGHKIDQQRPFNVHYDGQFIGTLVTDLIVDDLVIADPKVVVAFNDPPGPDDRLPAHHQSETGPPSEFQNDQARLEAHNSLTTKNMHFLSVLSV